MGLNYVARCDQCKRVVCLSTDTVPAGHLAKSLADWAKRLFSIERMSTDDARKEEWGHADDCPRTKKRKKAKRQLPTMF